VVCNLFVDNKLAQVHYVCGVAPKEMNHTDIVQQEPVQSMFAFCLSIFHAWVHFF
jgi:hypothetical protein